MNPVIYIPLYFGRYLVANLLVAFSVFIIGVQHAQQGQSFLLIIQIDLSVMAAASPLGDSCTEITAKTVSFVTYGAYAYNGFNGSIVLCTRVGDELHFFNIGGREALQLGVVLQKAVVYIDDRCPFAKTVYPSSEERSPGICFNTSLASFKDASRVCRTLVSNFPPFSRKTGRAAVMTVSASSTASVCNIQLWVLPVGQGWQRGL